MPWNGSGTFNRIYSWVADKAAGLDISSSRMDTDTNDIASSGFGNCLTRDGQGQPSANLPMAGFRHTGVSNAVNRNEYSGLGQVQDGLVNWTTAGGSADAITATYTPAVTALADGELFFVRAGSANATTTPTFSPNGLGPYTITKNGGQALVAGDVAGNNAEAIFRYNQTNTEFELLNPAYPNANLGTGDVKLTLKTSADPGWLLFDDGTFGSASSGSSNSNSNLNKALFTLMFNNISDTYAPLFTSTGSSTTRSAQGTAAAAWAANCRMSLPKTLGRALAVAGSGSGLTTRTLAQTVGEETHLLTTTEIPSHNHGVTDPGHTHVEVGSAAGGASNHVSVPNNATSGVNLNADSTQSSTTGISINNAGGGGAHNNMQPSSFFNIMVKQ